MRIRYTQGLLSAALSLAVLCGCAGTNTVNASVAVASGAAAPGAEGEAVRSAPNVAPPACLVRMQLFSEGDSAPKLADNREKLTGNYNVISDPVCVQTDVNGILAIPDLITLHGLHDRSICQPGTIVCKKEESFECLWNHVFRDAYPLSFAFFVANQDDDLASYVRLLRVFRNGVLAYRWTPGHERVPSLFIMGSGLKGTLLPHLAPIDVRIVPRGFEVPAGLDTEQVARQTDHLEERLLAAFNGMKSAAPIRDGKLDCELQKLEGLTRAVRRAAECLLPDHKGLATCTAAAAAANSAGPCSTPEEAKVLTDAAARGTVLSEALAKVRNEGSKAFDDAKQAAIDEAGNMGWLVRAQLDQLKEVATKYWHAGDHPQWNELLGSVAAGHHTKLMAAADRNAFAAAYAAAGGRVAVPADAEFVEFFAWFRIRASGVELERILAGADNVALSTIELADASKKLVSGLAADVKKIVKDDEKAYELYNHLALSLNGASVFEPRAENPPAIDGELVLPMKYADSYQTFYLAPWFAVPARPDDNFDADVSLATAIPVIDAIGGRYQFGPSRFADARMALGISMFGESFNGKNAFHLAPQGNFSLGTIHIGVGYIVTNGGGLPAGSARMRLLLGLDLIKLISGRNVEAM